MKIAVRVTAPWVRIPPSPPQSLRSYGGTAGLTGSLGLRLRLGHKDRIPPSPPFDSLMASHRQGECPERSSEASKSKGNNFQPLHPWTMASSSHVVRVEILRCADDSLYIGETNDVERRLARHNDGAAGGSHDKASPGSAGLHRAISDAGRLSQTRAPVKGVDASQERGSHCGRQSSAKEALIVPTPHLRLGRWRLGRDCDGHWASAFGSATKTESHPLRHKYLIIQDLTACSRELIPPSHGGNRARKQ